MGRRLGRLVGGLFRNTCIVYTVCVMAPLTSISTAAEAAAPCGRRQVPTNARLWDRFRACGAALPIVLGMSVPGGSGFFGRRLESPAGVCEVQQDR